MCKYFLDFETEKVKLKLSCVINNFLITVMLIIFVMVIILYVTKQKYIPNG